MESYLSNIDTGIYYRIEERSTFSLAGFAGESFENVSRVEKRFLTFDVKRWFCWTHLSGRFFAATKGKREQCFSAVRISGKCFSRKFQFICFICRKEDKSSTSSRYSKQLNYFRIAKLNDHADARGRGVHRCTFTDAGTLYGTNPAQNERQIEAVVSRHRELKPSRLELDDNGLIEISLLDTTRCASKVRDVRT